jgi:hypothetical protein
VNVVDWLRRAGFVLTAVGLLMILHASKKLPDARRTGNVFRRARWAPARALRTEYSGNGYRWYQIGAVITVLGALITLVVYFAS